MNIKAGILLDDEAPHAPPPTHTNHDSGKYEDRWVRLGVASHPQAGTRCVFLRGIEHMYLPVAHGEGKFIARDAAALARLESAGQLALRYVKQGAGGDHDLSPRSPLPAPRSLPFPDNPNGSMADVAGVCDTTGRVLGLMPHPERHLDPTHHPRWTRGEAGPVGDGLQVFLNAVRYFE